MQKASQENKSSPKPLYTKNIIIVSILVVLILSLLFNILILNKLSKMTGNLHSQGWYPVWGSSEGNLSEQEQEIAFI